MSIDANLVLEQIFSCMSNIIKCRDFKQTMMLLTEMGSALVHSDRASFWIKDCKRNEYWTVAASGVEKITIPVGTGIVGSAIEENKSIIINDPYSDSRFNSEVDKSTGYHTKSILCVPVINEMGDVIGAYQAINKLGEDESFTQEDARLIELVTVLGGKCIESHILYLESHFDQLTGLKNRRGLIEDFDRLLKKTDIFSIIMCDIDHFKKVNDTYGHNAGDAVLAFISDRLVSGVFHKGEVYRFGGEEFVILLPDVDRKSAVSVAEKLRISIEESVCTFDGLEIRKTMSFGVVSGNKSDNLMDNIKRADECLYHSKETGRNKVTEG